MHNPQQCALANLIKCGAFDDLHSNRRQLLLNLPGWQEEKRRAVSPQKSIFPGHAAASIPDFSPDEKRNWEYRILGMDVEAHFMARLRPELLKRKIKSSQDLPHLKTDSWQQVCGLLLRPHRPPTRSGKITVFFSLEDEFGLTDVTMFEDISLLP